MDNSKRFAFMLIAALLVLCITALIFDGSTRLPAQGDAPLAQIIISEICAKNDTIIEDNTDKHRDYIELYNPGEALNLAGYTLTDGTRHSEPLGDFYLPAGGYRIIFLDNDTTGFALSSTGGDCIQLLDHYGRIVVQTSTSAMGSDQVMLYDSDGTYLLSSMASPGFSNDAPGVAAFREGSQTEDSPLVISEMLTRNQSAVPDENGDYVDAIELYNNSTEEIQLGLYCITDNPESRFRYRLPDRVLASGEYLVIFCDSLNYIAENGYIHANFSLSVGETLMLTGPDGSYSALDIYLTADNTSLALTEDGSYAPMSVSLGYPNTEEGALLCADAILDKNLPLAISELLLSSAGVPYEGAFLDVVEIRNISDKAVSTEGWYLSDGGDPYAYPLPEEKLSPGEVMVIVCSQETTGFALSEGEVLRLTAPSLFHAPTVTCVTPAPGMSTVLLSEGYGTDCPSLGYDNTEDGQLSWQKDNIPEGLMISEVITSNESYLRGPYATTCDWVELYNGSKETVDLSCYSLSDDPDVSHTLPQILLEPGQYQIILLSEDTRNLIAGYPVLPFSLAATGEQIYLCCDGIATDYLQVPRLSQNTSYGRTDNGLPSILENVTPGKENGDAAPVSEAPDTLTAQGVYDNVDSVEVVLCGEGTIYYTTDCSVPDNSSQQYTGPITLTETTVIRAVSVEEGKAFSDVLDLTYVINENDTLPVVSLVADPDDLFGYANGIYSKGPNAGSYPYYGANFFRDWERKASVSLFELDGSGFSSPCGVKIYGNMSRTHDKKSLAVMFRGSYGAAQLDYPLFGENGFDTYESFVLRAGGQEFGRAYMRDELFTSLAAEYTDLLVQDYRPVVLYLNGQYWGVYFIREKVSEHFVAAHCNAPADTVTLAEINGVGSKEYRALEKYAASHSMKDQSHYDYLCSQMNVEQYMDYIIAQICIGNYDNSNVKFCNYEGGKWTWILFDADQGLMDVDFDSVSDHLNPSGSGTLDLLPTTLINALLKRPAFKEAFLQRTAWQMQHIWSEENIHARIDEIESAIAADMVRDCQRWGKQSYEDWQRSITKLKEAASSRDKRVAYYIQSYFRLTDAQMRSYGFDS